MYHRFDENKYPSTNIKMIDFNEHLKIIKENNFLYVNPNNFEKLILNEKLKKKVLITIDDGFLSFYKKAWPVLKKDKIPFILFVNTKAVGQSGYMNWRQIKEIAKEDFAHIGNHSYSHEYLVDRDVKYISEDINRSILDFKNNLGKNSKFFSYPFGEYSKNFKQIIKDLEFKYAFGQHSGVVDETKDFLELPRFPINEKYGQIERFKTILNTLPLKYKFIKPDEKYITSANNPPQVQIEFYNDIKNIKLLNCYSNEGGSWKKSEIIFIEDFKIKINLNEKFTSERGRINCSLREKGGYWRWMGIQFVIAEN